MNHISYFLSSGFLYFCKFILNKFRYWSIMTHPPATFPSVWNPDNQVACGQSTDNQINVGVSYGNISFVTQHRVDVRTCSRWMLLHSKTTIGGKNFARLPGYLRDYWQEHNVTSVTFSDPSWWRIRSRWDIFARSCLRVPNSEGCMTNKRCVHSE